MWGAMRVAVIILLSVSISFAHTLLSQESIKLALWDDQQQQQQQQQTLQPLQSLPPISRLGLESEHPLPFHRQSASVLDEDNSNLNSNSNRAPNRISLDSRSVVTATTSLAAEMPESVVNVPEVAANSAAVVATTPETSTHVAASTAAESTAITATVSAQATTATAEATTEVATTTTTTPPTTPTATTPTAEATTPTTEVATTTPTTPTAEATTPTATAVEASMPQTPNTEASSATTPDAVSAATTPVENIPENNGNDKPTQAFAIMSTDNLMCGCHSQSTATNQSRNSDAFISYRVSSERDLAEKIVYRLEAQKPTGVSCWWDKKDLEDGAPWLNGVCGGLKRATYFVPLLSSQSLSAIKSFTEGQADNFLMEIETAVDLLPTQPEFIVPLCIGRYLPVVNNDANATTTTDATNSNGVVMGLVRFQDFNVAEFPNVKSSTCSSRTVRETISKLFSIQCIHVDPEDLDCSMNRLVNRLSVPKALHLIATNEHSQPLDRQKCQ